MNKTMIVILLGLSFFGAGCGQKEAVSEEVPQLAVEGQVSLSTAQLALTDIETGMPDERTLSSVIMARGHIRPNPQGMMKVHAPVNGTIAEILVKFGESVKKGTPLIRITDPLIVNLQEEYLQSSLKLKLLESEYARQSALSDQGINALKEYEKTETELQLEKVRQKALYARLKAIQIDPELLSANQIQAGITLRSPGKGKIEFLQAEPGKYIQREEPLFEIIDPRQLYVEGFVFEKDIRRVKTGQSVRISSQNGTGEAPLMQGKVSSIGSRVDQENRTVKIRITLDKPTATDLITGMFVALGIETGSRLCYTVPEEAIVYDNDNRSWLFVLKAEGNGETSYEVKEVNTDLVEDGYVELSKEDMERLQGKKVVLKGAYYLWAELLKGQE